MEKEKEKIYDNIVELLETSKLKKEDLKQLCDYIHNFAKQKLSIKCDNISFEKLDSNSFGYTINNKVVLNEKYLKLKQITELIHTIFHEDRHLYQHQSGYIQKDINFCYEPSLPIIHCNDFIYLLNEEQVYLNPFYLYYTSKVEKDAEGYANIETYNLLRKLKQSFIQNKKLQKLFDKQLEKLKIKIDKHEQEYKSRIAKLKIFEKSYKNTIKNLAIEKLTEYQNTDKIFKFANAIFQVYTDTEITEKYFNYAIENKDTQVLYCVLNSPYSKIDNNLLNKFFEYCKNQNIDIETIKDNLHYWNKNSLQQKYNLFNSPEQNISPEDEIKQAKIKLYKSLQSIEIQEK